MIKKEISHLLRPAKMRVLSLKPIDLYSESLTHRHRARNLTIITQITMIPSGWVLNGPEHQELSLPRIYNYLIMSMLPRCKNYCSKYPGCISLLGTCKNKMYWKFRRSEISVKIKLIFTFQAWNKRMLSKFRIYKFSSEKQRNRLIWRTINAVSWKRKPIAKNKIFTCKMKDLKTKLKFWLKKRITKFLTSKLIMKENWVNVRRKIKPKFNRLRTIWMNKSKDSKK